jgi:uncharacterized protein
MAVQVNYPGVYIDEFAPGAPIEGVGTNTAGFIGTAAGGPIDEPQLIQSWDAFKATFGDFIAGPNTGYLGPAVYGFFLNGGTTCYVLRHGTGTKARISLPSRTGSVLPPALAAEARQEGTAGNSLTVKVTDSSLLANALSRVGGGTTLKVQRAGTSISALSVNRSILTVADTTGFAIGDPVLITDKNSSTAAATIAVVNRNTSTLELTGPLDAAIDLSSGTRTIRSADLTAGRRTFRIVLPAGLTLNTALPRGTTLSLAGYDSTNAQIGEVCTVESSGGDVVTVAAPLKNTYSLADVTQYPATAASLEFDLEIKDEATGNSETYSFLSMSPEHPNYWRIAVASLLVSLSAPAPPPTVDDPRPQARLLPYQPTVPGTPDDPAQAWTEISSNRPGDYLDKFKPIDEISLVCIPGATTQLAQQAIRDHCEIMGDRFAILDSRPDATVQTISDQFADVVSAKGFAALYFPWIVAHNPVRNADELWPPSGHLAGIYARSDAQRGVHKAPANEPIRGALGVQYRLTDAQQGPLNLKGIDILRVFQGLSQPMVWGARTTASDRNWQYVNIRRLFLYLEESIQEGIRWAVFEPNNLELWQKLKRTITDFLTRTWRDGALFGATAEEAFYVRIDEILNPPATQALGRLYIEIGVRPTYPAEFIVVRIGIWQGGSDVTE